MKRDNKAQVHHLQKGTDLGFLTERWMILFTILKFLIRQQILTQTGKMGKMMLQNGVKLNFCHKIRII